jgi:hypothetical protein
VAGHGASSKYEANSKVQYISSRFNQLFSAKVIFISIYPRDLKNFNIHEVK